MYKMTEDERDHGTTLFSLENHARVPDTLHSSGRVNVQVGKATQVLTSCPAVSPQ